MNAEGRPFEMLLAVHRDHPDTLGVQIEGQVRRAIRDGVLRPGAQLPSTRALASQLHTSRRVVVEAYGQLAAEGYLSLRQGARPRVSDAAANFRSARREAPPPEPAPRFDFRPSMPDVSMFPRAAWLRSLRNGVAGIADADLGYGDPRGVEALRTALAEYLGRVRGVVADPELVFVTSGYSQGHGLVCRVLAEAGAKRIAFEDPSNPLPRLIAQRAGLEPVPVAVDDEGLRVSDLDNARADAVVLTPAHQHPTGVVLSGPRRAALLAWLRERAAIAIEDDYDAEYRYDRAAVGSLQGLDPDRVVYAGSTSKTLAPGLRIGWLVVPARLRDAVTYEKVLADRTTPRVDQLAFADFLGSGGLDRHLRRMRLSYRARRDAMADALTAALPETKIRGIAAGLHVTVALPDGDDEDAIFEEARRRRIHLATMRHYRFGAEAAAPTLLLGYPQMPEPTIRAGIRELADAIRTARAAA